MHRDHVPPHLHDGVWAGSPAEQPQTSKNPYYIHKLRFSGPAEKPLQYLDDSNDGLGQEQDSGEESSREEDSEDCWYLAFSARQVSDDDSLGDDVLSTTPKDAQLWLLRKQESWLTTRHP